MKTYFNTKTKQFGEQVAHDCFFVDNIGLCNESYFKQQNWILWNN